MSHGKILWRLDSLLLDKHVLAETSISSLSLGGHHNNSRRIVGGSVLCCVLPYFVWRGHLPKWRSWLMSESSVVSWKSAVKRRLWSWCEVAANLWPSYLSFQLTRVLHGRLWQKDLNTGRWRISLGRSRCQEMANGDCNRLRTLVCVYLCL
jgi:hypothetical protein